MRCNRLLTSSCPCMRRLHQTHHMDHRGMSAERMHKECAQSTAAEGWQDGFQEHACWEAPVSRMLLEKSGLYLPSVGVLTGPPAGLRRASESAVDANRLEAKAGLVEDMVLPPMRGERGAGDAERAGERLRDILQGIKARTQHALLDRQ